MTTLTERLLQLTGLRRFSLSRILYFPSLFSTREKRIAVLLAVIIIASGGALLGRLYVQATVVAPEVGGRLAEGIIGEPRTINPLYALRDADRDISRLVFSGLFSYTGAGELIPDLAERYEISEDGKTYTVVLKDGLRWHDGERLSADDVEFTVRTAQNQQYKSPVRANWQGVSVERVDERTVRFVLRVSYAPFIENLTLGILPKHLWETVGPEEMPLHELNLRPVGSGPYRFEDLKQNKDGSLVWMELERNTRYHREGPYLKSITFHFFKTEDDILRAWRAGTIESFGPVSLRVAPSRGAAVLELGMPRIFGIFFNAKKAPLLEDKALRAALNAAVDRAALAATVSGGAIPTAHPLPWLGGDVPPADPAAAMALLEKAGWTDSDGDGIRDKTITRREGNKTVKTLTPLRFTLTTSDWPDLVRVADAVRASLGAIGVDTVIEVKPFSELETGTIRTRNFEMLLFGEVYGHTADPFAFWHSSQIKDPGLNVSLYTNKAADTLLEAARRTADETARQKNFAELAALIETDVPAIFLYSQLYLYLVPGDLAGALPKTISLPADRFNEAHLWHRDTERVFRW